ncbi:hypothetical protein HU200_039945 [Digitaria exilis]|uniref:BTB domain-containing protein n=1 Tax=Digitaria exilis TaxID=1010633 RepID=A0A835B9N9_9POAL|nr:hypothetical protein HU200_039945 [Digitaria exilis]
MLISKTVSTSTAETVQRTHVFHIEGYSQQRGFGRFIRSTKFSVGGNKWVAFIYPDRIKLLKAANGVEEHHVVAGVATGPLNPMVRPSYELRLVNQMSGLSFSVHKAAALKDHNRGDVHGHYACFLVKRSVLEAPTVLQHDRLTMEWIVTLTKQPRKPEAISFPKIEMHFAKLLEEKEGVDIEFSVEGMNFAAHKMILATRSPVFKAELCGPLKEVGTEPVNVANTLALADQHHCDNLKDACIEFMASSSIMDVVAATQGFKNLKRTCPSVIVEALEKTSRLRVE